MNPNVSLVIEVEVVTEVAAVAGETMKETGLMDDGDGGDKRVCRTGHHVNGLGV